jgi:hypothetical protein
LPHKSHSHEEKWREKVSSNGELGLCLNIDLFAVAGVSFSSPTSRNWKGRGQY